MGSLRGGSATARPSGRVVPLDPLLRCRGEAVVCGDRNTASVLIESGLLPEKVCKTAVEHALRLNGWLPMA